MLITDNVNSHQADQGLQVTDLGTADLWVIYEFQNKKVHKV